MLAGSSECLMHMRRDTPLDHLHRSFRRDVPAFETLKQIRAAAPSARVIGFASHVDLKSLKAAREAGYDQTLSRSEFTALLPNLLRP